MSSSSSSLLINNLLPDHYGWVIFTCVIAKAVTSTVLGFRVMRARRECDVQYPNLYATPGYHKHADVFNRVQRGHQSMFETAPAFMIMALIGGIKHPIATSIAGILYNVGNYLFFVGYADAALHVKHARYAKGGVLKWVGFYVAAGTSISMAGSCNQWW